MSIEAPNISRPPPMDPSFTANQSNPIVEGTPGAGAYDAQTALEADNMDRVSTYERVEAANQNNFHAANQIEAAINEGRKNEDQLIKVNHSFKGGRHQLELSRADGTAVGEPWTWKKTELPPTHKIDEQLDALGIAKGKPRTFELQNSIRAEHVDDLVGALQGENGGNRIIIEKGVIPRSGTLTMDQIAFARIDNEGHAVMDRNGTFILAELGKDDQKGPKKIAIKGTQANDAIVTLYDVPTAIDGGRGNDDLIAFKSNGDQFTQKIDIADNDGRNFMALVNGKGSIKTGRTSGTDSHLHPSMRRDSRSWDGSSNKIAVVNGNVKVTSQAAQDVLSVGGKGKHTFELEGGATHFIQDFTSEKQYQARDLKIGANTVVAIERMGNGRMQESPTEVWRSGGRSFFNLVSLPPIRLNSDGSGESAALSAESIRKNQSAQTFWSFMTAGAGIGAMAGVAAIIHNNSSSRKSRGHYPVHGGYGPPSSPYPGPSQHFALSFANQFFNMFFQKTRYR